MKPFNERARRYLTKIVNMRLLLIRTDRSQHKSFLLTKMEQMKMDISTLQSDHAFAQYIQSHIDTIQMAIPKQSIRYNCAKLEREFRALIDEANEIVKSHNNRHCEHNEAISN